MVVPKLAIHDTFSPALARAFSASRMRPDLAKAINRIMQQWVSYAINKIPKADRAKIKARLEAPATRAKFAVTQTRTTRKGRESSGARYQLLKQSVANYIVWSINYKKARGLSGQQYFATVGRFIGARQYSAGHLKGGLYPALRAFRAKAEGRTTFPEYTKHLPGEAKTADASESIPMAEVQNWAGAILKIRPTAFEESLPEIERTVNEWIAKNLQERAKAEGIATRA